MSYKRDIDKQMKEYAHYFSVLVVTGARQTGKTTFIRENYPGFAYFNLEQLETLQKVKANPRAILEQNSSGIIFDEIHKYPELLGEIQTYVDVVKTKGKLIISGSQNLLMSEKISQSLAGRAAYCYLYPMSINELQKVKLVTSGYEEYSIRGGYPAVHSEKIPPQIYYEQYVSTYLERDVRDLRNIGNLLQFRKFLGLVAGRVGQLVNYNSLAGDVGVSNKTIEDWISVLEATFIIYRIPPYFENIGKRLIKSPKIYFWDTGLLNYLLGIRNVESLSNHYLVGGIFENLVVSEIMKIKNNNKKEGEIYFYRDSSGKEVDLVIKTTMGAIPIEIKSANHFSDSFLDNLKYWSKLKQKNINSYVIYAGSTQNLGEYQILNWRELDKIKNW